jgi:acetate kinase
MADQHLTRILTINSGSSSIKFSLYHIGKTERLVLLGKTEQIGLSPGSFSIKGAEGETLVDQKIDLHDHDAALKVFLGWLQNYAPAQHPDAVGHRIVHGGRRYHSPQSVTGELMEQLRDLIPLAPGHLPHEIRAIEAVRLYYPEVKQVVCFDTAFHRKMPQVAQRYALPRNLWDEGILRYGFHGLSCEYILKELSSDARSDRVIIAHLGHGCSMTAVKEGHSVDTTMGLTPMGGLVMSRRPGDLDPGVILHLIQQKGMTPGEVSEVANRRGGLLGISPYGDDMRTLLERGKEDPLAALAIEIFCYQAKKFLGALASVLGGLDTLIFTGGIGENAPPIRWRICEAMEFIGLRLELGRNEQNESIISPDRNPVVVRVMKTNEELMIARHTFHVLQGETTNETGSD